LHHLAEHPTAPLLVAHWERLRERLLVQPPREVRERLLEQQSVEQPGYSGDSLLRLRRHRAPITVIPSTATQRTAIPLTDTQPMGIRPTHSRAIAIQVTRAPRPMDTPAALDTRPTPVHRVTVHQSVWRSRITSVLPAMNREPNWDIRLTLVLRAMKTRGTWEKAR